MQSYIILLMSGTDFERLNKISDSDLRIYVRAHGFEVTDGLLSLVEKEGPQVVLSEMKAIVNDLENGLREENIPLLEMIAATRAVDYATTITDRLSQARARASSSTDLV